MMASIYLISPCMHGSESEEAAESELPPLEPAEHHWSQHVSPMVLMFQHMGTCLQINMEPRNHWVV